MKKFAIAAVAAAAMSVGVAHAYTAGTFSNGFVVPNVIHNGVTDTTTVGLVNQSGTTAAVFWTFFNQDSKHITDGCFTMTNKDYEPFVWSERAGGNTAGVRGYLVFTVGATTGGAIVGNCASPAVGAPPVGAIAGHAFQVMTATNDVAYTPVIDGPLTFNAGDDLTTLNEDSLISVAGAAQAGSNANFSMRYYLQGGAKTNIVVWSTGSQKGSHTVNIYNDSQLRKSVNFDLAHTELDWFDPAPIVGRPANFTDGFIEWNANTALTDGTTGPAAGSVFSYSVIDAPAFGAVQSVLGFHR